MTSSLAEWAVSADFPKSARLLKSRDFRFRPYQKFQSPNFLFVYTDRGSGRLGISISRKVLRTSVARNRVRRLLREVFRQQRERLDRFDIHVIGSPPLSANWEKLTLAGLEAEFASFVAAAGGPG